ncbi:31240_t:CDS:1, partial [Racocetra persica]
MSTSNEATNITINSKTKTCSCCEKLKPIAEFIRMIGSRMTVNILCNACANRDKRYRLNKKVKATNNESTQLLCLNENIQPLPLDKNIQLLPLSKNNIDTDSVKNSSDKFIYNIYNIKKLVNIKFRDSKKKVELVKFSVIVKLERELVNEEIMSLEIDQNEDAEFCE